jgi:signal transduction histidine kinase
MPKVGNCSLTATDLATFDRLQTPIWIYNIQHRCIQWANQAALELWHLANQEDLSQCRFRFPANLQAQWLAAVQQEQVIPSNTAQWLIHQDEEAIVMPCHCSGVQLATGQIAILVEGTQPETQTPMLGKTIKQLKQEVAKRKQAEACLQQKADLEHLIGTITQRIRQSLNLEETLQTTVQEIRQTLQTDRVLIYRIFANGTGKTIAEEVLPGFPVILNLSFPEEVFPLHYQRLYSSGRIAVIPDVRAKDSGLTPCLVEFVEQWAVRAKLVIPIMVNQVLWGLLIAHHCRSPRFWQAEEVNLLKHLADQVAIAIQQAVLYHRVQQLNTRLEQQIQERTAELQQALNFEALLKRITDKVRDSLNEDQILRIAVEELALGTGVECCSAGLYNADYTILTIKYEYNLSLPSAQDKEFVVADAVDPYIYHQMAQAQCSQFCFLVTNPLRPNEQKYAILACPMFDDRQSVGDLWLFKCHDAVFNDLEVRLAQQVANQCAIALRQARLYQAAQAQVAELERLNRLKDDFLSTVTHELRTPMYNIKMATQMLDILLFQPSNALDWSNPNNRQPSNSPASDNLSSKTLSPQSLQEIARYFQILQDECLRETNLINDLLDLSRLDAGTEPLMLTTIDLRSWLLHIAEPFEERARQQQQQLQIDIPENLPPLTVDLAYLERICTELLNNACKYTPAAETIAISVQQVAAMPENRKATLCAAPTPSSQNTRSTLLIRISNSGVEVPASELAYVFDKFYRVPNHDPWKYGGTGLGLALVKKRVEQLKGTIVATSEQGWTTFTVQLPCQTPAKPETKDSPYPRF